MQMDLKKSYLTKKSVHMMKPSFCIYHLWKKSTLRDGKFPSVGMSSEQRSYQFLSNLISSSVDFPQY